MASVKVSPGDNNEKAVEVNVVESTKLSSMNDWFTGGELQPKFVPTDSLPGKVKCPVEMMMNFKEVFDVDGCTHVVCTVIQRVFFSDEMKHWGIHTELMNQEKFRFMYRVAGTSEGNLDSDRAGLIYLQNEDKSLNTADPCGCYSLVRKEFPLVDDITFQKFPFSTVVATLTLELNSITALDKKVTLRPNICIWREFSEYVCRTVNTTDRHPGFDLVPLGKQPTMCQISVVEAARDGIVYKPLVEYRFILSANWVNGITKSIVPFAICCISSFMNWYIHVWELNDKENNPPDSPNYIDPSQTPYFEAQLGLLLVLVFLFQGFSNSKTFKNEVSTQDLVNVVFMLLFVLSLLNSSAHEDAKLFGSTTPKKDILHFIVKIAQYCIVVLPLIQGLPCIQYMKLRGDIVEFLSTVTQTKKKAPKEASDVQILIPKLAANIDGMNLKTMGEYTSIFRCEELSKGKPAKPGKGKFFNTLQQHFPSEGSALKLVSFVLFGCITKIKSKLSRKK